jgi:hypothetical protein
MSVTSSRLSERLSSTRRRSDSGNRWLRVVMAVLATIGAIDTGSITLKRWGLLGSLTCPGVPMAATRCSAAPGARCWDSPCPSSAVWPIWRCCSWPWCRLCCGVSSRARLASPSSWGLLLLSTGMAVFSLVLMGVMVLKIQAFCFFCVLSAVLSLALFVLSLISGEWPDRGQLLFRLVLVVLVVGLAGLGWAAAVDRPAGELGGRGVPPAVTSTSTPEAIALADHLTTTGAVMYSAWWCPHCNDQKQLFGKEATSRLTIVECAADGRDSQTERCASKGIQGFPSWEIGGKLDSGVKSLQKLAELSEFRR